MDPSSAAHAAEAAHAAHGSDAALTIAVAIAAGLVSTALARHARLPAIVLLLATGAILGPDVLGVVQPQALGSALHTLVGFAVAVILFEGGLNLHLGRIRRESVAIRRLITIGSLITVAGAAFAARTMLGWDARSAILFGTLVIVTGPTVIGPLLRRIKLKKKLQTLLEAEGVLIDPVGAIVAVVALDVALQPSFPSLAMGVVGVAMSLGSGALVGFVGGWLITFLLRPERLIPEGLENTFALAMVLLLFHLSNSIAAEAGIAAVTVAGVVVGNTRHRSLRDLMEFKEQLTVLLIGMLFVILAADVRFAELQELGWAGVGTVLFLMLVVRPINIWACTWASDFTTKERAFLSWIAPRGIVAAAVASFFAGELDRAGLPGGSQLRAMVFLVIAITVTVQGLTGGFIAKWLGVRRVTKGIAILGAGPLARAVGRSLRDAGEEVLFLDSNPDASHAAESEDFKVVFGNGLEESTMLRAGMDGLAGCIGLTPNAEVNLLFARKAREEFKV
ncbi:MAG: sodium:proton antiporter, partial [Gemmatimonadetes bacterium]|nr:sodium:proton antiporter [Gemmatimonadota bacterium]